MVATSSLDLGVDFLPVERVLQIGSAKGADDERAVLNKLSLLAAEHRGLPLLAEC